MRPEQHPPIVLHPTPTQAIEHTLHRSGESVVRDVLRRDTAEFVERNDAALEERFLRHRRVDPVDRLPEWESRNANK